jgi:hypothetical protein
MLVSDLNELVIDNLKKEECKPLGLTFKWLDRKGYVEYLSHNPALGVEVTCTMMERGHRIQAERLALALKKGERK